MYKLRVFSETSTPAPSLWAGVSLYFFIKKNIHFSSFSAALSNPMLMILGFEASRTIGV